MNFRQERIEQLLYELRYEVTRGLIEHDIELVQYRFIVPRGSRTVQCEFVMHETAGPGLPYLQVVK